MNIRKLTSILVIAVVSAALAAGSCRLYSNSRAPLSLMQDAAGSDSMAAMTLNTILNQMMDSGTRSSDQAENSSKNRNSKSMMCYFLILLSSLLLAEPSLKRLISAFISTFSGFLRRLIHQYHFRLLRPPDIIYSILCRLMFLDPVRKSLSVITAHSGNNPLGKLFPRGIAFPEPALLTLIGAGFFYEYVCTGTMCQWEGEK